VFRRFLFVLMSLGLGYSASAVAQAPTVRTQVEAFAEDAAAYAARHGVGRAEALHRLLAQEESVAATDRIRARFRDRLAGISFEHEPAFRIVVLLTGPEPVPDETILAGGITVPIVFRTGALATEDRLVQAMTEHRDALRSALPNAQGMGVDQRTGELVLLVQAEGPYPRGIAALDEELEALTGVPIHIRVLERPDTNLSVDGGARVVGVDPRDSRRYACTTGFVVTDGARTGIVTAAHCPDNLTYFDPAGGEVPLTFVNGWGVRYQDVQVHVAEAALEPRFYSDTNKTELRPLTGWRNRTSTRAGEAVCRRGETTGYSCSEVELTDYAPPGELCAGPCDPVWVSVTGPTCRGGDSGGPVFSGTVAFGIVKGGNYDRKGACNFYYYMSTDYLPEGWKLLTSPLAPTARAPDK
jgi:hypothetical protein